VTNNMNTDVEAWYILDETGRKTEEEETNKK